ncbi:6-O-methylguanine DNA methyltransferase [Nocardia nova]|nr:MGMT family protein [Nocardia nova]MDN2495897.1 6-O-methylguanine DNA methyltransferase [Nocardia nova]
MSRARNGAISAFARRVLDVIDQIPPGRVMSYGAIGDLVGAGPRQIGRVMTAWADETHWHRVVRARPHDVLYLDAPHEKCVGNEAAMTAPKDSLGAHDGNDTFRCQRDEFLDRLLE